MPSSGASAPPPRAAALGNLALATASLALCGLVWLLAELGLRWAHAPMPFAFEDMAYLHVYSEAYGWVTRPGFHVSGGRWPETTVNAAGYRGHQYPPGPHAGHTRVLMLGDSLTFGYGVSDDETTSRRLEALMPSLEVVNLGVQGYGTDQALLRFEGEGLGLEPDVAVLNFCLANDFRDNASGRSIYDGAFPKPFFTLDDSRLVLHRDHLRLSPLGRAFLFLSEQSLVVNGLRAAAYGLPPRPHDESDHPPARELTVALVQRMAQVARDHGVRFIVAIYPDLRELQQATRRSRSLLEAPGLEGVFSIDLREPLLSRGINEATLPRYALDNYFHANAEGNEVIAEILADALRDSGHLTDTSDRRPRESATAAH
jgi:lysophospholipase L1-like esterase